MGPQTEAGEAMHQMKYRVPGETFRDVVNRLSQALTDSPEHYHQFRHILGDMRFMPAGRIQGSIGSSRHTTPFNCYVSGQIADSFVEGDGCIMQRAHEAAATMRMGGGIGYDFSTLRPRGDLIRKLQSQSSGPVSFIRIFNEVGLATASSGHRRGAQMGILRVDHPDIEEFILAKQNQTDFTGFNFSVAITDEFMEAMLLGRPFDLRWGGRVYRTIDPVALWELIMRSTWDWAEPGVQFIDTINRQNNLNYCEEIAATNPCSEQPLPPFGACLLGSFNLVKYLRSKAKGGVFPSAVHFEFDWYQFHADIPLVVRAMDRVVDLAHYPLLAQKQEAVEKRRMGLGIMGLANAAEALGLAYGSQEFLEFEATILEDLKNRAYMASALLARDRGPCHAYSKSKYLEQPFIKGLRADVQEVISRYGIRNSHLTSIAPTGTISFCADNVSSGIEPVWAFEVDRPVLTPTGRQTFKVKDYGAAFLGTKGKTCSSVTIDEHIDVLTTAQKHVDSAISKTCNVPSDIAWEDFKYIYVKAWERGAKSCSTFRVGGLRDGLLTETEPADCVGGSCSV